MTLRSFLKSCQHSEVARFGTTVLVQRPKQNLCSPTICGNPCYSWRHVQNLQQHPEYEFRAPSCYKWKKSLSVCPSSISTTVHPIDFTLGGYIAEDSKKCSVECQVAWMSGSQEICNQQYQRTSNRPVPNSRVLNRNCTSI